MINAGSLNKRQSHLRLRRPICSTVVLGIGERIVHKWLRAPFKLVIRHSRRAVKNQPTIVFIHGIGDSADAWKKVIASTPKTQGIVAIDLLGFGESPKPHWATYDARVQARALIRTLDSVHVRRNVILVGHSLGALVSVEAALLRPKRFRELILCSPPFYEEQGMTFRQRMSGDHVRRQLYSLVERHPDQLIRISSLARKVGLFSPAFELTTDNIHSYIGSLKAAIINQTSLADARLLRLPITILYGRLDPLIIPKHIRRLAKGNKNIYARPITAGHEVKGRLRQALEAALHDESRLSILSRQP